MADSGAAKASGVSGSRPCSHDRSARSMNTIPRGNEPVLFSRSANSTVLSAASTVSGSIPRSARAPIVSAISRSTLSASAGSMPFRPIENMGCRTPPAQPLNGVIVGIEEQLGVGRVIVFAVECLELLVSEVRNVLWIAAGIEPVGNIGIKRLLRQLAEHAVGGGIVPLHLVEHHALIGERCIGRVKLVMPAFLLEDLRRQARLEHRIQIDIDKIVEILNILACHRIARLIRKRHGIEKGIERTLQ